MYAVIIGARLEATYARQRDAVEHFGERACGHCLPCSLVEHSHCDMRSHCCAVAAADLVEVRGGIARVLRGW